MPKIWDYDGWPPKLTGVDSRPLKWHGGKDNLAERIIGLFPPRCQHPGNPDPDDPGWVHYVEPYFGGGAVLFANDPEGISEVANDIDYDLTNFWNVLRCGATFDTFRRWVEVTPFCESTWELACKHGPPMDEMLDASAAFAFFVRCRQSLSGRMKGLSSISRNRTRRGMNAEASAWLSAVDGLPKVHERLKRVVILNRPALDVIRTQDGPRTLFYLDPPYLHETRVNIEAYKFEMSQQDHQDLLNALLNVKGRFLLSGYRSDLYDGMAEIGGWDRVEFDIANHSAGPGLAKRRMTECVWKNFRED